MPVDASRHYRGPGLGDAVWKCPACGAENAGPIPQGCQLCGAGKPGRKLEATPPPTRYDRVEGPGAETPSVFELWRQQYPDATIEQAFTAGYTEGVRAARRAELAKRPPVEEPVLAPEDKVNRTLIAALTLFRDQILSGEPEEVATGEWCSSDEVTRLLEQLQGAIHA